MSYSRLSDYSVDGTVLSSRQGIFIGVVETMPDASLASGVTVLYEGAETDYEAGKFYSSDGTSWSVATVSQSLQDALDSKQDVVTGAVSTVVADDLTANRTVVSDSDGKIVASGVTSTEVGYLSGVTSAIQTQIDSLLAAVGETTSFEISVVNTLPATGDAGTIYFAPSGNSQSENVYDEFLYVNDTWEQVGSTTFTLDIAQSASGITVNGTALQSATTAQTGLMTSAHATTLGGLGTRMTAAESGIEANAADIATNAADIATNADDIAQLQADLGTLESMVATNTSDISANADDISDLASTVSVNASDTANLTQSVETNASDIIELTQSIATNSSNISTNASNISANTTSIAANASSISALDDRVTALEDADAASVAAGTGIAVSTEGTVSTVSLSEIHSGLSGGSASEVPAVTVDSYGRTTSVSVSKIYAPTTVGKSGQVWTSDGSTGGAWADSGVSALTSRVSSAESKITTNSSNISTNASDIAQLQADVSALDDTVTAAVSGSISILVVDSLPTTGVAHTIYFVPNGGTGSNICDEYMYVDGAWELIGSSEFTLTIEQATGGISINGTSLQNATAAVTGLMTSTAYSQLTGAVSDIGSLQTDVDALAQDIATNATDIATNKSNIVALSSDLGSLESTVAANTSNISSLQTTVDSLSTSTGVASVTGSSPISASTTSGAVTVSHATSGVGTTYASSYLGSATAVPRLYIDSYGHITGVTTATIYPPTSAGTAGQVWRSDGSGAGQWATLSVEDSSSVSTSNVPLFISSSSTAITLTRGLVRSASDSVASSTRMPTLTVDTYGRVTSLSYNTVYPPTTVGTSGQYWMSDGSGVGTWTTPDSTPTSGSTSLITSGAVYDAVSSAGSDSYSMSTGYGTFTTISGLYNVVNSYPSSSILSIAFSFENSNGNDGTVFLTAPVYYYTSSSCRIGPGFYTIWNGSGDYNYSLYYLNCTSSAITVYYRGWSSTSMDSVTVSEVNHGYYSRVY